VNSPYAPSLATFHDANALMDGVRALMPPQGVLVIAAYMPQAWEVRLVDENVRPASRSELAWAHAIFWAMWAREDQRGIERGQQ
jgi:hopanoid C-2 methylase